MTKDKVLDTVDPGKRNLIKKLAVGSAFAVPTMVSFDMNSLSVHVGSKAYADGSNAGGGEEG
jgi:hypothetical protein